MMGHTQTEMYGGGFHQRNCYVQQFQRDEVFPSYDSPHPLTDNQEDYDDFNTDEIDVGLVQNMGRAEFSERKPFDKAWTLFFGAAMLILGSILIKSTANGSSAYLSHPINYQGLACGYSKPVKHLPVLYYPINPKGATSKQVNIMENRAVCLRRCPTQTDVDQKGFIPVSDNSVVQDKSKAVFISVLHTVRSPVYAAITQASHYCVPVNPELKTTVLNAISKRLTSNQLRQVATGLLNILPTAMGLTFMSIIASHILSSSLAKAQGVSAICLSIAIVCNLGYGVKLLFTRSNPTGESIFVPGMTSIAVGIALIMWVAVNFDPFASACKVAQATYKCLDEMPKMQGLVLVLQLSAAVVGFISMIAFILLQSCLELDFTPLTTSLDPNGGVQFLPLERTLSNSYTLGIQSILIFLAVLWFFECLICLMKYMVAYTGILYYFTPEGEFQIRHLSSTIPMMAMKQALLYTSGSLAYLACIRWISRGVRLIFMTSAATRFDDSLTSDDLSPAERHSKVRGKSTAHDVCDRVHNGIFTELAIASRSGVIAAKISESRLKKNGNGSIAGLVGLTSLITWSTVICIGTVVYVSSSLIILAQNASESQFVTNQSPFLTAAIITMLSCYVASINLIGLDIMADSLLYCTMVEGDVWRLTSGTLLGHDGGEIPRSCPTPISELLETVESCRNSELSKRKAMVDNDEY